MFAKHRTHLKHAALLSGLAATLGTLPGCSNVQGSTTVSQIRIIDASPNAPGMDIYQGSQVLAYNLGFGTITSYVPITPGSYIISADTSGSKQQLVSATGTFNANSQYTVLLGNTLAALQETILTDQATAAPGGDISIRFLDEATAAGAVDMYLVPSGSTLLQTNAILTDVTFGSNTGYVTVASGTYKLVIVPTGTVISSTTVPIYSGASITYTSGSAQTDVLLDQTLTNTTTIQVITAPDYAPAGS